MGRILAIGLLACLAGCGQPVPVHTAAWRQSATEEERARFAPILAAMDRMNDRSDAVREYYYRVQGVYDVPSVIILHSPHFGRH